MSLSSSDDLARTRVLFEQWRATRPGRSKIPDELLQAGVGSSALFVERVRRQRMDGLALDSLWIKLGFAGAGNPPGRTFGASASCADSPHLPLVLDSKGRRMPPALLPDRGAVRRQRRPTDFGRLA